jgi:hypothetical protein
VKLLSTLKYAILVFIIVTTLYSLDEQPPIKLAAGPAFLLAFATKKLSISLSLPPIWPLAE